jgi:hypothetical protein
MQKANYTPRPTNEQIAAMNRQMVKNLIIFVGVKAVVYYGMYRWAKSLRNAGN